MVAPKLHCWQKYSPCIHSFIINPIPLTITKQTNNPSASTLLYLILTWSGSPITPTFWRYYTLLLLPFPCIQTNITFLNQQPQSIHNLWVFIFTNEDLVLDGLWNQRYHRNPVVIMKRIYKQIKILNSRNPERRLLLLILEEVVARQHGWQK